jgi:hypothetical protein
MTVIETTTEHRCEALTIGDIPPYGCATSAITDRRGRAVCASHTRALRIRWFDGECACQIGGHQRAIVGTAFG